MIVILKVHIRSKKKDYDAKGLYDFDNNVLVVLAGSKVSAKVAHSEKFHGATLVEKYRNEYVENCVVIKDVTFSSPSTAANFILGRSCNGLITWKDEDGNTLRTHFGLAE